MTEEEAGKLIRDIRDPYACWGDDDERQECSESRACQRHWQQAYDRHAWMANVPRYAREDIEDAYSDPSDAHKRMAMLDALERGER